MPPSPHRAIDRREALRRAAVLLGGALSASTASGVLAGCEARGLAEDAWTPRALNRAQAELVATIAEHIIPETDTPGARAVGVHRFVDAMLAESYSGAERQHFLVGLADVDARARRACGRAFLECLHQEQRGLLEQLDREALASPASPPVSLTALPFFRTMKELTLVGYYTSQIGATRELRHAPLPGRFEGCVPRAPDGRTWAV